VRVHCLFELSGINAFSQGDKFLILKPGTFTLIAAEHVQEQITIVDALINVRIERLQDLLEEIIELVDTLASLLGFDGDTAANFG